MSDFMNLTKKHGKENNRTMKGLPPEERGTAEAEIYAEHPDGRRENGAGLYWDPCADQYGCAWPVSFLMAKASCRRMATDPVHKERPDGETQDLYVYHAIWKKNESL